jgi:hypothetical protein
MYVQLALMAMATIFGASIGIVWSLPFILLPLVGYQLYILADPSELDALNKLKPYASTMDGHDNPSGFILGWPDCPRAPCSCIFCPCCFTWPTGCPYFGFIQTVSVDRGSDKKTLYLICAKAFKAKHLKPVIVQGRSIKYIGFAGNYFHLSYPDRKLPVEHLEVRTNQAPVIDTILTIYEQSRTRNAVVYIYGKPRCGKSVIGKLVAKARSGMFINTYKPYEHGFSIETICKVHRPSAKNPLIIMFEEVDQLLDVISRPNGEVPAHKNIPTEIRNKQTWNTYFDNLENCPHVIIIMTSNVSYEKYDEIDASLLGVGRVDAKFHLE